jgi:hypothetical protein
LVQDRNDLKPELYHKQVRTAYEKEFSKTVLDTVISQAFNFDPKLPRKTNEPPVVWEAQGETQARNIRAAWEPPVLMVGSFSPSRALKIVSAPDRLVLFLISLTRNRFRFAIMSAAKAAIRFVARISMRVRR